MGQARSRTADHSQDQLIEAHMPLVRSIASRYAGRGEDLDDLMQLGAVALLKASKRFDPKRGVAFGTFATPAIEGEIRRHFRDQARPLRIPRNLERMGAEVRRSDSELSAALGRSPTLSELAIALSVEERDIERALGAEQARESISISTGEGSDLLADSEGLAESDDRMLLARSLRALGERERRIVFLRFHADMTERQIAQELGISQAHVSRLLGGALSTLREELGQPSGGTGGGDITGVISPTGGAGAPKIRGVGAQEKNPTLGHYLELPYHVEVRSERDGEESWWKATVEELPGCASRGSTPDEAVAQLRPEMESWLSAALADHREIPVPGVEAGTRRIARGHSGRFLVRMPKSLHEELALAAERQQVSLNRFVTDALASSVAHPLRAPSPTGSERPDTESDEAPIGTAAPARAFRLALATNLVVVVVAGLVAVVLLVIALERGI